ncbi:hypothetical protein R1flu_002598 [Riccia fluitans]|uniref:Elongation factor 2 n=1 Tax=Riccia fluitans TaxID=41844 RepID=A0ABD1Y6K5_9MARC
MPTPVMTFTVQPRLASDLPKLVEELKKLTESNPPVVCSFDVENMIRVVIAVADGSQVDNCLRALQDLVGGANLSASPPIVLFRETVTDKSHQTVMSISFNKLNRFYFVARPLENGLLEAFEDDRINLQKDPSYIDDLKRDLGKNILFIGPEDIGSNMVVDMSKGSPNLNEIKDDFYTAFRDVCKSGPLMGTSLRGVAFELCDAVVHDDVGRRRNQIRIAVSSAMYGAMVAAKPRLYEPVYLVEIQVPQEATADMYQAMNGSRGDVFEETVSPDTSLVTVKAYLPVAESFKFWSDLEQQTTGKALVTQTVFHHWDLMPGDPTDPNTREGMFVRDRRLQMHMKEDVPAMSDYVDHSF